MGEPSLTCFANECFLLLNDGIASKLRKNPPHTDNTYRPNENVEPINCFNRFIRGLSHDDSHLAHIADIVRQANAARR